MFYSRFLELCKAKGVSPTRACRDMGLHPSSLRRWREGNLPRNKTLQTMGTYFSLPMQAILPSDEPVAVTRLLTLCEGLDENQVLLLSLLAKAFHNPDRLKNFFEKMP